LRFQAGSGQSSFDDAIVIDFCLDVDVQVAPELDLLASFFHLEVCVEETGAGDPLRQSEVEQLSVFVDIDVGDHGLHGEVFVREGKTSVSLNRLFVLRV